MSPIKVISPTQREVIDLFAENVIATNNISAEQHIINMSGNAHGITISTLGAVSQSDFNALSSTVSGLVTGSIKVDPDSPHNTLADIASPQDNLLYIVGVTSPRTFYMWINGQFKSLGATTIDLSSTAPITHVGSTGITQHALAGGTNATAGFSQANFTQVEKNKLADTTTSGALKTIISAQTGVELDALGVREGDFVIILANVVVAGATRRPGTLLERIGSGTSDTDFAVRGVLLQEG